MHIKNWLERNGIEYEYQKLDFGDYAIKGLEHIVVVERKADLNELACNFTRDRDRFKREFERAKEVGAKVYLLVESTVGYEDIFAHRYRSRFPPKNFYASIKSWEEKGYFEIVFCSKRNSGKKIIELLQGVQSNVK